MSDFAKLLHLLTELEKACDDLKEQPYAVFFPKSWVSKILGISRYKAGKFCDQLVIDGLLIRQGNRYRYQANNNLFHAMRELQTRNSKLPRHA